MAASSAAARRFLLLRHRHILPKRHLSSPFSSTSDGLDDGGDGGGRVKIFDRDLKRRHRDRAAWAAGETDALTGTVAENLLDRLEDCRKAFPSALCLGGSAGAVRRVLRGRGGIEKLIMMDMSADMVKKWREVDDATGDGLETHFVVGDEEFLPIKERLALKPDGLFLAAILGGETLKELRIACTIAQMEREGGISPRMSPLAQVRDAGNLLTRAGFTLPGVDVDHYTVKYNNDGTAINGHFVAFKIFVIANILTMCSSTVVLLSFLWAWQDPLKYKLDHLMWSHRLTFVACLAMLVALVSTVYVTVAPVVQCPTYVAIAMGAITPITVFLVLRKVSRHSTIAASIFTGHWGRKKQEAS
ncbi:hypothetical protein PR202_ga03743 [Eleusine coracana subsp. coracana]|uniref:PGG domain-containing protein n=1 Tax=Eleusine coracana subsp. coracana TaxID=191504 RepID=A0AAV5BQ59_ELECO|nr:hypothetical protein PR202_ga03743 [Eleusine coracana subsp. coracana]